MGVAAVYYLWQAVGRGGARVRGGRPCSQPSARRSASQAALWTRSRRWLGGKQWRTSGHEAVARLWRVTQHMWVTLGSTVCTSAASLRQVAEGLGSGSGLAGGVVVPRPAPPIHRHGAGPAGGRLSL